MTKEELLRRFDHHPPDEDQERRHKAIRREMRMVAEMVDNLCPEGREKSLAWTHLEEAMFWANAAIAREGK